MVFNLKLHAKHPPSDLSGVLNTLHLDKLYK